MTTHEDLVAEMPSLERLNVQDRLKLARKRRTQQLKRYAADDKEFTKRSRKSMFGKPGGVDSPRKIRVNFAHNIQLLEATARGDIEEVRQLLGAGVDPNVGNEDGLTALHQCCIDNNETVMKLLVENKADVNITDRELWTPLHAASTCGHVNLTRFLVSNGAELLAINSDGNMPYDICEDEVTLDFIESQMAHRGITQEHIDELRDIAPNQMLGDLADLRNESGDIEARDDVGATYLHIAAANGYDKVAKYLLDNNADVNAKDDDGWQPIHAAACWAHGEMIQLLVQYGADLEAKTNNEETPLTICEDEDLKNLINQLKAEIHAHRSLGNKLVRRNSSRNKRSSSIRRSSKREKVELKKLDAKGEAMFIQSQVATDDVPSSDIDEVNTEAEETPEYPSSVAPDGADQEELEGGEINGALETDIVPMPVITEETPESPARKAPGENGVMQNGGEAKTETGLMVGRIKRQPKSILKKRKEQEDVEELHAKKSRKEKVKEQEEGRLREREERERVKQREREERQRKKEEKEREKQRIKEEKRQRQQEREKEQQKRKTITEPTEKVDETPQPKDREEEEEQQDKNHTGNKETLAELKRQRASEHGPRTLSNDSVDDFETVWSEGRKDSFDILKDHHSQNSTKKKSPHIARKLFPHRPASGSYSFTEANSADSQRDSNGSEQNGVADQTALNTSDGSTGNLSLEPYPGDPPLKRFTATQEAIGGDEDRRCCTIL